MKLELGQSVKWYRYEGGLTHGRPQIIYAVIVMFKPGCRVGIKATLPDGTIATRYVDAENLTASH